MMTTSVEFAALEEEGIRKWKQELRNAIIEYFCSADGDEFCRLAAEWDMSSEQAAIIVKYILIMAMERTGEQCLMAVDLLCHCVLVREELSKDDIVNGFKLIMSNISDVKLDIPDAGKWSLRYQRQHRSTLYQPSLSSS
ncbi:Programmed cell death protein 4 [Perkinsus olseni]|uniref:Programmed cell death protein 4 n=1 Tax=Perkinsus olseni TaxID=32597 RepID=A0A7J6S4W3_PEROL|nr:Programmed cell death protein 4 [Perkinsus olseni]